jgi:hypothetical protein
LGVRRKGNNPLRNFVVDTPGGVRVDKKEAAVRDEDRGGKAACRIMVDMLAGKYSLA